jgi:hypothetical protein
VGACFASAAAASLVDPVPTRPFPFEAARDLVGILRAMYAAEQARPHPQRQRLDTIRRVARDLQTAARMAAPHDPGTAVHDRAVALAEGAVLRLREVVEDRIGGHPPLEVVLERAGARVLGKRMKIAAPTEREIKWAVGRKRG